MRPLRVYWDAEHGWTIDTPVALVGPQLARVCEWVRKVQRERVLAQPHGERREQMAAALKALSPRTLHQNLMHSKTEGVLYTE